MATIGDVAKRAGVSKVTVSRVLNKASNVNPETRARVEQAIADLQYLPSQAARSLRVGQTQTIALVVPDITNVFWTTVARGVEDAAQRREYSVLLCNTDESAEKQRSYISAVMRQRVDGVMIAPYNREGGAIQPLRAHRIPVVVVDRRVEGLAVDCVRGDSLGGARSLVEHLIHLGYRKIAMISGPRGASTAEERVAGYLLALRKAGLPFDRNLICWGEFRATEGERLTSELYERGTRPDAIVAANNQIALGVWEGLSKRNLHIPQDVALVCFDEMAGAARLFQFFTVAAQPAYEIGATAAELLFERIQRIPNDSPPKEIILPSRLVLRASCGRLREKIAAPYSMEPAISDPEEIQPIPPLDEKERALMAECLGWMKTT